MSDSTSLKLQVLGRFGASVDPTFKEAGKAADAKVTGDRFLSIEGKIADLLYEAISITSFTNNVNTVEIGSTVNAVAFAWQFNKTPAEVTFDGDPVEADSTGITLSDLALKSGKSWILSATDERGATATKSTSVNFLNGVYYGLLSVNATVDSDAILSLSRKLQNGKALTFTVNALLNQRIAYAIPSRYGTPNFNVGGFDGGFTKKASIAFQNASGYTESYDVWLSDNTGLGTTTVKVT